MMKYSKFIKSIRFLVDFNKLIRSIDSMEDLEVAIENCSDSKLNVDNILSKFGTEEFLNMGVDSFETQVELLMFFTKRYAEDLQVLGGVQKA